MKIQNINNNNIKRKQKNTVMVLNAERNKRITIFNQMNGKKAVNSETEATHKYECALVDERTVKRFKDSERVIHLIKNDCRLCSSSSSSSFSSSSFFVVVV